MMQDEQLYEQGTRSHRRELRHPQLRYTVGTGSRVRLGVMERRVDV